MKITNKKIVEALLTIEISESQFIRLIKAVGTTSHESRVRNCMNVSDSLDLSEDYRRDYVHLVENESC